MTELHTSVQGVVLSQWSGVVDLEDMVSGTLLVL